MQYHSSRQQPNQPVADALHTVRTASSKFFAIPRFLGKNVERHHGKIRLATSWYLPERSTRDDSL